MKAYNLLFVTLLLLSLTFTWRTKAPSENEIRAAAENISHISISAMLKNISLFLLRNAKLLGHLT